MRDKAVAMLTALGVAGAADDPLLDIVLNNVQWRIKNLSNLSEIPEGLESLAVSMAVGEYLNMKKCSGQLEGFDLDAAALPCNLFRRWTMFRIIKAGAGIGLTENLNYIKKAENGCYILCPEHDASGIVFEGVAYHLLGRAAMDELETVSLEETDAGTEITKATEAGGIVFVTLAEAGSIDPTTAAEHADLFAEWAFPVAYTVGQIRRYNGTLYKCVQAHTSQADWTPDTASSLWSKTSDPAEEWPEWSQPVGAHDAYSKGAKVSHKEKHWISTVDSNVWEPGVYGWEESTDGV